MSTSGYLTDAYYIARLVAAIATAGASLLGTYYDSKYLDIADNYYDIYADEFEFYRINFMPKETILAQEVFATPVELPNYTEADAYTYAPALLLNDYYERFRGYFFASPSEFDQRDQSFERTAMFIDYDDFARRYYELRRDARNERRHDRQADQLNIGQKQQALLGRSLEHGVASFLSANRNAGDTLQGIALDIAGGYAYKAGVIAANRTYEHAVDQAIGIGPVRPSLDEPQRRDPYKFQLATEGVA